MKKLFLFLAAFRLAACTTNFDEPDIPAPQQGHPVTLTGLSDDTTRTLLSPGDGGELRFAWSADDCIWVDGLLSSAAGVAGTTARFGFESLPGEAPYRVYYNRTGEGARAVVPAEQTQTLAGEPQPGLNGDFGYAVTDAEGRFTLSHATSYVWFDVRSQDVDQRLLSVTLTTADPTVALTGVRTFDGEALGEATDAANSVTLSFGEAGVALPGSSDPAEIFAAAVVFPADCRSTEVYVTYSFADGSRYTETKAGRLFEAGRTYRISTEIRKSAGGTLALDTEEDLGEPVCLHYGSATTFPLTAQGWIAPIETLSAPAGWTVETDIARRELRIVPPETYAAGVDLEKEIRIDCDGKSLLRQSFYVLDFTHPEGTFVLMEGNMTTENGTIVYFDQYGRYHQNVYEEINGNEIGNVLQDMYMANDRIYFLTQNGKTSSMGTTFNGDGRYVVCDAHTLQRIVARDMNFYAVVDSSTGATQSSKTVQCWPQHIVVVSADKGYIQYSTSDMETHSGIRIIDLKTNIIDTKDVPGTFGAFTVSGATKARMVFSRGKVFAGRGNAVIVIDPSTDQIVKEHVFENRQLKDVAKGADGKIYAVFTGEYEIDGDLGYYGNVVWKSPTMIVALDAAGEIVDRQELPETVQLRTGTASPTIQLCASFTQPHLYFIGKTDFSAYEAMRYNYQTGKIDWDYITEEIDADKSGGSIIYGYMGVHPVTEQLWVGKSSYTESNIHVYDVSRSDAVEYASFYQRKASPAGVDFAYRFSEEWINR